MIAPWAPSCPAAEKAGIPFSVPPASGAPVSGPAAGERRIAVTEFVNRCEFGNGEFAEKARDAFEAELASTNRFTLVERSRLNLIMKEQAFSQSGLVDEQTMSRLGKLAAARYICTGAIESLRGQERQDERLRSKVLSIFGIDRSSDVFGLTKGSDPYQTAWDLMVTVAIRVIDVEKGTIVFNRSLRGEAQNVRLRQSTTGPVYDSAAAFEILKPVMEEVARQMVLSFPD
jgi:curli biogenesis system outer membrane secretion channel CsgG